MNKEELIEVLKTREFDSKIINAIREVKREDFVPEDLSAYAYEDIALTIEEGATISQPSTVAFMLYLLDPKDNQKILEIGSGSGYTEALIASMTKDTKIYGLEIIKDLAVKASNLLKNNPNIAVINKDGSRGLEEMAPFDRIIVSASSPNLSFPYQLAKEQLADPGILVAPVKYSIYVLKKENGKISEKEYPGFVFVPIKFKD